MVSIWLPTYSRSDRSRLIGLSIPAPGARGDVASEQEHLDHGAVCESVHDGPRGGFDFGGRLAHLDAGDSLDLLPERLGRAGEQLAVKLLHLSGPFRTLGQGLL